MPVVFLVPKIEVAVIASERYPRITARLALTVGLAQALCALLQSPGMIGGDDGFAWFRALQFLQLLAFGSAGLYLVAGSHKDARARDLGMVFVLGAASFGYGWMPESGAGLFVQIERLVGAVPVDTFLPFFFWRFVADFPRRVSTARERHLEQLMIRIAAILGWSLLLLNVRLAPGPLVDLWGLETLSRVDSRSHYWTLVYGLAAAGLARFLWRIRGSSLLEQRRARLFVTGLMVGSTPTILFILLDTVFGVYRWLGTRGLQDPVRFAVLLSLATVPLTTAYSVVVSRVLTVRMLAQQLLAYALAKGGTAALAITPFAVVAWFLYDHRHETLEALLSGPRALLLAIGVLAGTLAMRLRGEVVVTIDRLFFRDRYDARKVLTLLAEKTRRASSYRQLAELLSAEIDRALHLRSLAVLAADLEGDCLLPVAGHARALDLSSSLCKLAAAAGGPVSVDLEEPGREPLELEVEDRQWLVDSQVRLIVPLFDQEEALQGLIGLGEKRSELPFSQADVRLLDTIGAGASVALERLRLRSSRTLVRNVQLEDATTEGKECLSCGRLASVDDDVCVCGDTLLPSSVPLMIADKFRLEQRLGEGSMGIVYKARDIALDRIVAIKTLPETTPEDALQLRREARAMASVLHPNLALIFGFETYRGTPILVVEYLEGGTLDLRFFAEPLPPHEVAALGVALAEGLRVLHKNGMLHGDVKPSNIGFTQEGTPKLLDFGLARLIRDSAAPMADEDASPAEMRSTRTELGTPLYLSPEALANASLDPTFDLWGLALVLYEALTQKHPFERASWPETRQAIAEADPSDPRQHRPDCPAALAAFLCEALSRDRRKRPGTARSFIRRLESAMLESAGVAAELIHTPPGPPTSRAELR